VQCGGQIMSGGWGLSKSTRSLRQPEPGRYFNRQTKECESVWLHLYQRAWGHRSAAGCILLAQGSYLGRDTGYTDLGLSSLRQFLEANAGVASSNRPRRPPSRSLPTHHSQSPPHLIPRHLTAETTSLNNLRINDNDWWENIFILPVL
jgi:hypothetical protein